MIKKKISYLLIFSLILFLLMSCVSAEDNITFENGISMVSSDIDVDGVTVDVDDNMVSSDIDVDEAAIESPEMCEDSKSHVKLGDGDEGEFIDVSEAYELLNAFRTEENVWQWNSDDKTKTHFNTNDTIWLQPLERDAALEETAKIRAKDLVEYYSHTRPNGDSCFSIFPEGLMDSGENIAIGFVTCVDVTEAWKETDENYEGQGHRRNMLYSNFNSVGIAAYKLDGYLYWVQDFGLRNNPKDFDSIKSFKFTNNTLNPEFSVEVPKYATGNFIVKINGNQIMSKSISNGKASITIYGLSEGTYTVELSYGGDYNYKEVNKTLSIVVPENQNSPDTLSFSHLNTLIKMNPYEVKLEKDYAFNSTIDSDFIEGIFLSEYRSIDGQGHRIDGKNQARAFIVGDYGITFNNINFTNCNANSSNNYGGAIYSFYYAFYVRNSSFANNHASLGGAIYSAGTVDLRDSDFTNNFASDFGGAVFTLNVLVSSNSTFNNNTNTQIFVGESLTGTGNTFIYDEYVDIFTNATRDNCIVTLNQDLNATQTIVINGSNVVIDGNGYTIDCLNKTRAFCVKGNNVTIKNIKIINAKNVDGLLYGGAIYSEGDLYVINSTFMNDEALGYGGAIYTSSGTKLHIIDSTFTNDTSKHYGGAISGAEWVEIINSTFDNNSATDHGGAIALWGELLVDNCSFNNNSAFVGSSIFDYCTNATARIKNSDFINGTQNRFGALDLTINAFVENCSFINNTCTEGTSGAICNSQNLTVMNCTFADNSALTPPYEGVSVGGAIVNYGEYVSIGNSTFTNNSADKGGAVANFGKGLSVENSTFIINSGYYGGAIYNWYGGNASVSNSTFECNLANVGGAIINDNYNYRQYGYDTAVVTVKDSRFNNNSANYGGAIYNCNSTFILINSTLVDNNASVAGTIYDWRGLVNVINSSISNSYVIFNATEGNVIFNNSRITENGLDVTQDYINHNRIQYNSTVNASFVSVVYGNPVKISVSSMNATGVVYNITSANGSVVVKDTSMAANGTFSPKLAVGEYTVCYRTVVDPYHLPAYNSSWIYVYPASSSVSGCDVSVVYGNPIAIKVSSVNATGVIYNITGIGGKIVVGDTSMAANGTISLDLTEGEYTVCYRTVVDGNHAVNANSSKIIVKNMKDSKLKVSVNDIIVGQSLTVNFTLVSEDNVNIDGKIDVLVDKHYNVTIKDGKGFLDLTDLPIGTYTVMANYSGDSKYNNSNASAKFNVNDRIGTKIIYENMNTAPVPKSAGRIGNYFCVKLVDENNEPLAGVPIKIGFNGVVYNKVTDSLGGARLQINLVREDLYTFAISFLGDDEYQASFEVAKIDVNKKHPKPNKLNGTTTATEVNKTQKETRLETSFIYQNMETESVLQVDGRAGKYFKVKLVDNNKKPLADMPIKIGFNGVIYNKVTNSTGEARLQINLIRPDVYTFAISYLGDTKYQASFNVAKITVNPHTPKLSASAKKFKAAAKTKTISATLKSSNGNGIKGKKIIFRINGKNYAANTNSKGVASVKISLTKKGTYTATAKFAGDSNIKATSTKFTVKII